MNKEEQVQNNIVNPVEEIIHLISETVLDDRVPNEVKVNIVNRLGRALGELNKETTNEKRFTIFINNTISIEKDVSIEKVKQAVGKALDEISTW